MLRAEAIHRKAASTRLYKPWKGRMLMEGKNEQ